jgi:hypothetical protein
MRRRPRAAHDLRASWQFLIRSRHRALVRKVCAAQSWSQVARGPNLTAAKPEMFDPLLIAAKSNPAKLINMSPSGG